MKKSEKTKDLLKAQLTQLQMTQDEQKQVKGGFIVVDDFIGG